MNDILKLLQENGFAVVVGAADIRKAIKSVADTSINQSLCSGYRVFPDGNICPGCRDCGGGK